MAIVTSFRFTPDSGAVCIDQESWHIWRRKNWFTDHLYPLISEEDSERFGLEVVYGGVGHPAYHREVYRLAVEYISEFLENHIDEAEPVTVEEVGKQVLRAFREVHLRRVNDKLQYLFGFDVEEFISGECMDGDERIPIRETRILDRAKRIINGKENTGYSPLSPAVEACLIGVDRKYGYSAFALKEADGVLGFQSCWFESLGIGRDGAAIRFAETLNDRFLDTRRQGKGPIEGIKILLMSICKSMDHYGQNGGSVRFMIVDGSGKCREERLRDIRDERARLSMEIIRGLRFGFLAESTVDSLLEALIFLGHPVEDVERTMFQSSNDQNMFGKMLRGYKISDGSVSSCGPEKGIFEDKTETAEVKVRS